MLNLTADQLAVLGVTPQAVQAQIDQLTNQHEQLVESVQTAQAVFQQAQHALMVNEHDTQAWQAAHDQLATTPTEAAG